MRPPLAHGSGWDELIIFAAIPSLYLAYYWTRRKWAARHGKIWPVPDETDETDPGRGATER